MQGGEWTRREFGKTTAGTALSAMVPPLEFAREVISKSADIAQLAPKEALTRFSLLAQAENKLLDTHFSLEDAINGLLDKARATGMFGADMRREVKAHYGQLVENSLGRLALLIKQYELQPHLAKPESFDALWNMAEPHPKNNAVRRMAHEGVNIELCREADGTIDISGSTNGYAPRMLGDGHYGFCIGTDAEFHDRHAFIRSMVCDLITEKRGRAGMFQLMQTINDGALRSALHEVLNAEDHALPSSAARDLLSQYDDYAGTMGQLRRHVRSDIGKNIRATVKQFRRKTEPDKEQRNEPPQSAVDLREAWRRATGLDWQPVEQDGKVKHYAAEIHPASVTRRLLWGEVPVYNAARAIKAAVNRLEMEEGEAAKYRVRLMPDLEAAKGSSGTVRIVVPAPIFNNPAYPARVGDALKDHAFGESWREKAYGAAIKNHYAQRA